VRVRGVGAGSLQGDLAFTRVLEAMGARVAVGSDWVQVQAPAGRLRAIDTDATAIPDAAMTAAVLALFADGTTRITGIGSWRVKETDRIAAMAAEIAKLGAAVQTGPDWIAVTAPAQLREAWIDTYDDHRMAMCLALAAARGVRVHIRDPRCVSKTFPDFFDELERLRAPAAP
jgi:3-phosphoshikimate 1-carboxyvinyltransferase